MRMAQQLAVCAHIFGLPVLIQRGGTSSRPQGRFAPREERGGQVAILDRSSTCHLRDYQAGTKKRHPSRTKKLEQRANIVTYVPGLKCYQPARLKRAEPLAFLRKIFHLGWVGRRLMSNLF